MDSGICLFLALFAGKFTSATPFLYVVCQGWWFSFAAGIVSFYVVRYLWDRDVVICGRVVMCMLSAFAVVVIYVLPLNAARNALLSFVAISGLVLGCRNLLMGRVIPVLGNTSYSFYLIHYYVIIAVGKFVNWSMPTSKTLLGVVVVLVVSAIAAFISYNMIEQKFGTILQAGIERLLKKRRVAST